MTAPAGFFKEERKGSGNNDCIALISKPKTFRSALMNLKGSRKGVLGWYIRTVKKTNGGVNSRLSLSSCAYLSPTRSPSAANSQASGTRNHNARMINSSIYLHRLFFLSGLGGEAAVKLDLLDRCGYRALLDSTTH